MQANLITHIKKFVAISNADVPVIEQYIQPLTLKKKAFLLKEGQVCKANYFVVKGCLRMYFITDKGTEQITQFGIENWWLADYMSLDRQVPSQFYIQAAENTEVFYIDHLLQQKLFARVPQLEQYFRLIYQKAYAASQQRIKFLYDFTKEGRYQHFITHFPGFVQRVPQYMLASYLGVTPEYLSEIRKNNR